MSKKQVQDISVMLDYDMLGSPNYARFIYDGNGDEQGFAGPNGSGVIEQVFKDFWDGQGLAYETIPFDGRSDYDAFTVAGIPAGGIFAGAEGIKTAAEARIYGGTAGQPYDACYHQACDTIANINNTVLDQFSDAVANSVVVFAQRSQPVVDTAGLVASAAKRAATRGALYKGPLLIR
ncbi:MAG TPA: M28 family peptidase [Solirubrobacteraceae bacterium]|nr:M28 family peptidase [Solirubrobacteraceae bacterium]